jgi:hypothetical protein
MSGGLPEKKRIATQIVKRSGDRTEMRTPAQIRSAAAEQSQIQLPSAAETGWQTGTDDILHHTINRTRHPVAGIEQQM